MNKCTRCSSYAVNPGQNGRDETSDLDLCDVCYWRKRAEQAAAAERKACADVVMAARDDAYFPGVRGSAIRQALSCAEQAIRARGEKECAGKLAAIDAEIERLESGDAE